MRSLIAVAAVLLAALGTAARAADAGPTVVELFTSQGCSSCPPADRLLVELAEREDVIALGFHVDYWDHIGWPDPFGLAEATARQRAYGRWLGHRSVFTPQMIIDGAVSAVGSRGHEVLPAIAEAPAVRTPRVPVTLTPEGADRLSVRVGPGPAPGDGAQIVLIRYDAAHATAVGRGENRGRTLTNAHVVRSIAPIGVWRGEPVTLTVPAPPSADPGGFVVLVQPDRMGPILGAARLSVN
ncbi:MAG: DUF1223 domain-containing protein [Inquilinaceae bacterium]